VERVEGGIPHRSFEGRGYEARSTDGVSRVEIEKRWRLKDKQTEILTALPTTQYFAKVKNRVRRRERQCEDRDVDGRPTEENERVKQRRKVPEKKRNERFPNGTELDLWSKRLMQKVEDENLKKVLKGEEVDLSYAKYRELGKKARYFYGVERGERWIRENKEKKRDKEGKINV